jgi:hypothetical protein
MAKKKDISNIKGNQGENIILDTIQEGYNLPKAYFDVTVEKAVEKKNIATVLNLQQLTGSRFENFYVDTDKVREANTISSLEQLLSDPLNPFIKLLFSGFTGSGKTTELIKLCFKLQKDFNIIIFSAWNRLKIDEITIESLLFEIVGDVLHYLYSNNLVDESNDLLKEIVDNITEWCSQTQIIKTKEEGRARSRGAGIEILKGVFFNAKTESRSGRSDKTESTRIEERKINDLIFECNKIFDYLKSETHKDTLIIIDDLEKISFVNAREFYVRNSSFIRDFHCKMVMTIPVELVYHSDFAIIQSVFGEAEVLPMIKIKEKDGKPFKPGIDALTEILERRLDLSLFENHCYKEAVKYSGGAIRELFRIIQRAAIIEESEIITTASMQKSINYHKDIFASRIQERKDEIEIKFEEYLEVLFDIYDGNKTAPQKNLALLDLLRTRAVMKYDGEGFYDTHPLLDSFIKAYKKKMLKNGRKKTGKKGSFQAV